MVRAKVSATIDRRLVQWVDEQVGTKRFRNRSHAIEWALAKVAKSKSNDEAVKRD